MAPTSLPIPTLAAVLTDLVVAAPVVLVPVSVAVAAATSAPTVVVAVSGATARASVSSAIVVAPLIVAPVVAMHSVPVSAGVVRQNGWAICFLLHIWCQAPKDN